jgi:hypothetical protein
MEEANLLWDEELDQDHLTLMEFVLMKEGNLLWDKKVSIISTWI